MHHGSHQAQDAARALEFLNARPVVVEPVKEFGVYRVGGLDAPFVFRFAAISRELLWLAAIEVHEGPGHAIARGEEGGLRNGLKEASAHDLEALFRVGRPPWRFDASEDVL